MFAKPTPLNINLGSDRFAMFNKKRDIPREWPSFKTRLRDLISEAEFSEMRMHGPKIAGDVGEIIAQVRRNTLAAVQGH